MNTHAPRSLWGMLASAAIFWGPPATAQPTTSISTEYLMTVYLPKEAALAVDSNLVISRDPAGGWVKGKVSGRVLDPSADWVRIIPSDTLRLRLDARVTIETDEHEIIYLSYNGRMKAHPAVPGWSICSMRVPCAGDQRRAEGTWDG